MTDQPIELALPVDVVRRLAGLASWAACALATTTLYDPGVAQVVAGWRDESATLPPGVCLRVRMDPHVHHAVSRWRTVREVAEGTCDFDALGDLDEYRAT